MGIFAKEVSQSSPLETTPERAWELMGDFSTYPDWNTLAPKMKGRARAGSRAIGLLCIGPRWMKVPFWPKIVTADAERELRWRGGLPGVFVGDHRMIIDGGGGKLRHEERMTGLLVLLGRPLLGPLSRRLYKRYNKALNAAANAPAPAADNDGDASESESEEA